MAAYLPCKATLNFLSSACNNDKQTLSDHRNNHSEMELCTAALTNKFFFFAKLTFWFGYSWDCRLSILINFKNAIGAWHSTQLCVVEQRHGVKGAGLGEDAERGNPSSSTPAPNLHSSQNTRWMYGKHRHALDTIILTSKHYSELVIALFWKAV